MFQPICRGMDGRRWRESVAGQTADAETCAKEESEPGKLTIHADRASMTSKPVAFLRWRIWASPKPTAGRVSPTIHSRKSIPQSEILPGVPKRFGSRPQLLTGVLRVVQRRASAFRSWLLVPRCGSLWSDSGRYRTAPRCSACSLSRSSGRFVSKPPRRFLREREVWINKPQPSTRE